MNKNNKFIAEYGDELFSMIFENIYEDRNDDHINVQIEYQSAEGLEKSGKVIVDLDSGELNVTFRDGSWNGSEILEYYI